MSPPSWLCSTRILLFLLLPFPGLGGRCCPELWISLTDWLLVSVSSILPSAEQMMSHVPGENVASARSPSLAVELCNCPPKVVTNPANEEVTTDMRFCFKWADTFSWRLIAHEVPHHQGAWIGCSCSMDVFNCHRQSRYCRHQQGSCEFCLFLY